MARRNVNCCEDRETERRNAKKTKTKNPKFFFLREKKQTENERGEHRHQQNIQQGRPKNTIYRFIAPELLFAAIFYLYFFALCLCWQKKKTKKF